MSSAKKILVADDDKFMREMLKMILSKAGFEVILAEDGKSAVEMAQSEKPDLVVLDGLMPHLHGFHACKAIKELGVPPKVIIVTAIYTKPNYKCEAMNMYGADAVIPKGDVASRLLDCIKEQLKDDGGYSMDDLIGAGQLDTALPTRH